MSRARQLLSTLDTLLKNGSIALVHQYILCLLTTRTRMLKPAIAFSLIARLLAWDLVLHEENQVCEDADRYDG